MSGLILLPIFVFVDGTLKLIINLQIHIFTRIRMKPLLGSLIPRGKIPGKRISDDIATCRLTISTRGPSCRDLKDRKGSHLLTHKFQISKFFG